MSTLLVYQDGKFHTDLPSVAICDVLADAEATVWLDVGEPTEQDIAVLWQGFGFHPLAIEDAIRAHERPKVDTYSNYYFIVFYTAYHNTATEQIETQALNMFIGANYLVTVHAGAIRQIEETQARWQTPGSPLGHKVSTLVHALLDAVVDDYFPLMDQVADRIDDLEDTVFIKFEESSIQTLFGLKKDLLHLRRVLAPERDVLNRLLRRELPVFKPEDIVYLQDIYDHIVRVTDSVDTYRDLLSSALDSYLSVQSNNLNQVVKVLTIASIILMSNALVSGIYGMNFQHMLPELSWKLGFPVTLGLMALISAALILYFRRRKWL